ncbi:hypothetical protein ACC733_39050, partial [Rhizobium johnstonii]|uniref:hypothetical protein n=1 Tax=Rhizobium johnstonii TaxID=3019933 RepID=UPI003F94E936
RDPEQCHIAAASGLKDQSDVYGKEAQVRQKEQFQEEGPNRVYARLSLPGPDPGGAGKTTLLNRILSENHGKK